MGKQRVFSCEVPQGRGIWVAGCWDRTSANMRGALGLAVGVVEALQGGVKSLPNCGRRT